MMTVEMSMKVTPKEYLTRSQARTFSTWDAMHNPTGRSEMTGTITIRSSTLGDVPAILDLALLDGGEAPAGGALLAFVDGELRAALGRADGRAVADPFHLTADLVTLLRTRVGQERPHAPGRRRLIARLTPALRREVQA